MAVTEWKALVVDDVDEKALMTGAREGGGTYPALPLTMVKLPNNGAAVLSWRWDGDHHVYGSKNVSLCSTQKCGDALLDEIVAFSTLYKSIQVIAAYDRVGDTLEDIMSRPWILSEAGFFRHNPTRIVYAGHSDQGASASPYATSTLSISNFESTLLDNWAASSTAFTGTILGVLCGKIGMCSISDFKAILPAYARVFSTAYEQMSRNDYLLTAAILCVEHARLLIENIYVDTGMFDRYTLSQPRSFHSPTRKEEMDIFLDSTKLATWNTWEHSIYNVTYELTELPDAPRVIFAALGLSEAEYEEFATQEGSRRGSLMIDNNTPKPEIEVRSISLEPFS